ncbi:MAG TPA: FAD-dependent oxidoreductase [Drouetiella sp.]
MSSRISRATFLKGLAGCGAAALGGVAYLEWMHPNPKFPCRMLGPSKEIGHLLRDSKGLGENVKLTDSSHAKVVIVGGGMSGLSAAWWLKRNHVDDFVLLDLESNVGGNSSSGSNDYGSYPWGAHYVPIANPESEYVRELFKELGIITGIKADGLASYDELMLCHEPQERLFKDGSFHEGLVPKRGLQPDENAEMARFFKMVVDFRNATGGDGKVAFAIPLDLSSNDPQFRKLDQITMAQWLSDNGFKSKPLRWYVNYCCRDDYGSTVENVSAWAGIHYFAGRRGVSANSEPNAVVTWPQGNGYLVERLKNPLAKHIQTDSMVAQIKDSENGLVTIVRDSKSKQFRSIISEYVIFAAPRFVAAHVIKDMSQNSNIAKQLSYAPWMVANISIRSLPDTKGLAPAWDNVSYYSDSLGYVMANHQDISTRSKPSVITYYYPLSANQPKTSRQELYSSTPEHWSELIVRDLEKVHPTIAREILSMDLWPWGHGMIRPSVGFVWGDTRQQMRARHGNILYAHSDMSGMSNFEEAQYHGVEAAKLVLQDLSAAHGKS